MEGELKPVPNLLIQNTQIFINNEFVNSISGKTFETINPSTAAKLADVQEGDKADINLAVDAAKKAFKPGSAWRNLSAEDRGGLILKLALLLERDKAIFATLESLDNGKPFKDSIGDIDSCIQCFKYFAGLADKIVGDTIPSGGPKVFAYTRKEPVGVVGGITPWNFPLSMATTKISASLAAGCTIVLKPAEQTPLTALLLAKLTQEAGFPAGVVNVVPGYGQTAGAALVHHPDVAMISFTGSKEVGKLIMTGAAAFNLKRVSLELGGKSPNIIFPDVDLDYAVEKSSKGVMQNMGQVCCAGSRTYVHESIYDEFVKKSVERAQRYKVGDPFDPQSFNGPQIDEVQLKKILELIESGKKEGGKLLCGGCRVQGSEGFYMQPTVFADVTGDMRIAKEEIFGPVQCIFKFNDIDDVIAKANDTEYGLAAGVFTNDINKAIYVSNGLQAGTVWVNCYVETGAQMPFGGYKWSGIHREYGLQGCDAYLETKSVVIKTTL